MAKRKLPYKEGDWFAVPLKLGGYGLGIVARADRKGAILGYFFGPKRDSVPTLTDIEGLTAKDALLVEICGDLGLLDGEWSVVGHAPNWRREDWPVPLFARFVNERRAWLVLYDEDSLEAVEEAPVSAEVARAYPRDGLSGSGSLEIGLTQKLYGFEATRAAVEAQRAADQQGTSSDLFDDDVALDVRGEFEAAIEEGLSPVKAAARVLQEAGEALEDMDDGPIITLALASLLLEHGVREHPLLRQARDVIETGAGLERWEAAGPDALAERKAVYARLAERLP